MKAKELIVPALALFLICLVSSFLLAGTNAVTKDKIAQTQAQQAQASRKIAFADAASFGEEQTVETEGKQISYVAALDDSGAVTGYVFTAVNHGYGGDVSVMTGVDNTGTVTRVVILSMDNETPGLGQNASKEEFWSQFSGKTGPFAWVKSGGDGNTVTGVTSASFTSRAVIAGVNDALDAFAVVKGAEQ